MAWHYNGTYTYIPNETASRTDTRGDNGAMTSPKGSVTIIWPSQTMDNFNIMSMALYGKSGLFLGSWTSPKRHLDSSKASRWIP